MNKVLNGIFTLKKEVVALRRNSKIVPDEIFLKAYYRYILGEKLNLMYC